ncbi:MAG: TetR/AcrR family transcriptional regulator [Ruminococcus sp.]|nr:TetR/AcrR family transcriptional regulator [Ruminococcus sp.]
MNGHQKQREQSYRMIEEGLFRLMEEKPYARITVSEITKKADVSRRTFYRLYREKDEVIHHYLGGLCQEYRTKSPILENYNICQIAREYFSFWYQYRDFLLLMHRCGLDEMLYYEISRVSLEVVEARIGNQRYKDPCEMEYFGKR